MSYQIFTDATADLSADLLSGCPEPGVIAMEVEMDGGTRSAGGGPSGRSTPPGILPEGSTLPVERTYTYGPGGNLTAAEFYAMLRAGSFASTSQINPAAYRDAFEPVLREGKDILYLGLTSGLSGTMQNALLCAEELQEEYPDRKVVCLDTYCASAGLGFLVREALLRQARGMDLDALTDWIREHSLHVCHWFTVDTFTHLRHGGRVSAASAAVGTMLQIKPLLTVDREGRLKVAAKPRGRSGAIHAQIGRMEQEWTPEDGRTVLIAHGDCPEAAEQLKTALLARFPEAEVRLTEVGPVIGSHTGPGMLALLYWGRGR